MASYVEKIGKKGTVSKDQKPKTPGKTIPEKYIGGSLVGNNAPTGATTGLAGGGIAPVMPTPEQTNQQGTIGTGRPKPNNPVNTTAAENSTNTITPTQPNDNNPQTGGNGNATTNVYGNAFQTYKTNLEKQKNAQVGQLDTEYNRQQGAINSAADNLNRNAYVTYMQRNRANRDFISNMGIARSGAAEKVNTANQVDYNRSLGNIGAYRTSQLSDAENAYNQSKQNLENEYNNTITNAENEYRQLEINRQNELDDLQRNLDFTASENAKDREQQAREADRTFEQSVKEFEQAKADSVYARQKDRYDSWVATVSQYDTPKKAQAAIEELKMKEKAGKLEPWEQEFYGEMLTYLRTQKKIAKQNAKSKNKPKKK